MSQPIPQKIQENNPDLIKPKQFNTLLVDGSNLLEISCIHKKLNSKGREIGGIYQFLLQLKLLLRKGNFRYVYVMWDGSNSGQLRHIYNTDYKANRDKTFSDDNLSDYMKEVEAHRLYHLLEKLRPCLTGDKQCSMLCPIFPCKGEEENV